MAILVPIMGGYGGMWLYFQRQQAKIISLLEDRIADRDKTIERLLNERNVFQALAWDAIQGVNSSAENTHRALSLTDALRNNRGD